MWILSCLAALAADPLPVGAVPFELADAYADPWRADHPRVGAGHLVALRVEPGSWMVRSVGAPVLQAGDRPVAVAARSETCLVAIVPAEVDLAREPIFLGPPGLPERTDARRAAAIRDEAVARGARPGPPVPVRDAPLRLADRGALYEEAARMTADCGR